MKKFFIIIEIIFALTTISHAEKSDILYMNPEITGPSLTIDQEHILFDYMHQSLTVQMQLKTFSDRTVYLPVFQQNPNFKNIKIWINNKEIPFEPLFVDYDLSSNIDYRIIRLSAFENTYSPIAYSYQDNIYRYDFSNYRTDTIRLPASENIKLFLSSANKIIPLSNNKLEIRLIGKRKEESLLYSTKKLKIDNAVVTSISMDEMIHDILSTAHPSLEQKDPIFSYFYNQTAKNINKSFESDIPYFYFDRKDTSINNVQLLKFMLPKDTKTVQLQWNDIDIDYSYKKIPLNTDYFGKIQHLTVRIIPPDKAPFIYSTETAFQLKDNSYIYMEDQPVIDNITFKPSRGKHITTTKKAFLFLLLLALCILFSGFFLHWHKKRHSSY